MNTTNLQFTELRISLEHALALIWLQITAKFSTFAYAFRTHHAIDFNIYKCNFGYGNVDNMSS